jgi:hypothetical protein
MRRRIRYEPSKTVTRSLPPQWPQCGTAKSMVCPPPNPVLVVGLSQRLLRPGNFERPAADLTISTRILSDARYASVVADPEAMISIAAVDPFLHTGYSGHSIGQRAWFTKPKSTARSASVHVVDGRTVVYAALFQQPANPTERDPGWRPLTKADYSVTEYAARLALSNGLMAEMDFQRLQNVGVRIADADIVGKRSPEGSVLVPLRRTLRAVAGRLSANDWGFYTATVGSRTVALVIASRELVVGEKRITLPLPVLFDGSELWVEKYGLASALGIEIR